MTSSGSSSSSNSSRVHRYKPGRRRGSGRKRWCHERSDNESDLSSPDDSISDSSSSDDSSSSSSGSSSRHHRQSRKRKRKRKARRERSRSRKKSKKKSKKKKDKKQKKTKRKKSNKEATGGDDATKTASSSNTADPTKREEKDADNIPNIATATQATAPQTEAAEQRRRAMVPMSREQYEAQQKQVRQVYDESTGRMRLVRGTGEIIEQIVTRDMHSQINQLATRGDGSSFARDIFKTQGGNPR